MTDVTPLDPHPQGPRTFHLQKHLNIGTFFFKVHVL